MGRYIVTASATLLAELHDSSSVPLLCSPAGFIKYLVFGKTIEWNPNKAIIQPASDNRAIAFPLLKQRNHLFFLLFSMQISRHMESLCTCYEGEI